MRLCIDLPVESEKSELADVTVESSFNGNDPAFMCPLDSTSSRIEFLFTNRRFDVVEPALRSSDDDVVKKTPPLGDGIVVFVVSDRLLRALQSQPVLFSDMIHQC